MTINIRCIALCVVCLLMPGLLIMETLIYNHGKITPLTSSAVLVDRVESVPGSEVCASCVVYNLSKSVDEDFECVSLRSRPPTPICLHSDIKDKHVSKSLRQHGIFEEDLLTKVGSWLTADQDLGLIDIGANIGLYTLSAAASRHLVLAVEPYIENIKRLHKAVQLAGLQDRITLLHNAIGDNRHSVQLKLSGRNQSNTKVETVDSSLSNENETSIIVNAVTLNDLVTFCPFKKAVLKIDIEGYEPRAFVQADQLFREIDIKYISMEWVYIVKYYKYNNPEHKRLVVDMVEFLGNHGYIAVGVNTLSRLEAHWSTWPPDVFWIKSD